MMQKLVEGQGSQSYQTYVEFLLAETQIKCNPIVIIQDMVLFGIKTGIVLLQIYYLLISAELLDQCKS